MLGLFVKIGQVTVNGRPIDEVAPVFEIDQKVRAAAEVIA
jgi:hypothetical protein